MNKSYFPYLGTAGAVVTSSVSFLGSRMEEMRLSSADGVGLAGDTVVGGIEGEEVPCLKLNKLL